MLLAVVGRTFCALDDSTWSPSSVIFFCFQCAFRFINANIRRDQDLPAISTASCADSVDISIEKKNAFLTPCFDECKVQTETAFFLLYLRSYKVDLSRDIGQVQSFIKDVIFQQLWFCVISK